MIEEAIIAWHAAVDDRDMAAARAAVTDPVDVSGPRGSGPIPAAEFADWIVRSGIRLRPVSWHPVTDDIVVVEQEATWPGNPDPAAVATVFRVRDGRVSLAHRFASFDEAHHMARRLGRDADTANPSARLSAPDVRGGPALPDGERQFPDAGADP